MIAIAISYSCALSFPAPFWAIPATFLTGGAAASGIAAISSLGVVGGFLTPWLVGYTRDLFGDFRVGLGTIACLGIAATIPFYLFGQRRAAEIDSARLAAMQEAR
jgi:nitrate/nitrite transporter NarK